MSLDVPYNYAQEHLAEILDQVEGSHEIAVIHRQGHSDVALVPADDLASLRQAARQRSPKNAFRLLAAIRRTRRGVARPREVGEPRLEVQTDRGD
jgi:PHD/YefM family antitoxin component YafN of YafNO toxin-antitoxin module